MIVMTKIDQGNTDTPILNNKVTLHPVRQKCLIVIVK